MMFECPRTRGENLDDKNARNFSTARRVLPKLLFLDDLGVLQHGNPATLSNFASYRDCFPGELGQCIVHRLVIADDEIGFSVRDNPDRTIPFDTFGGAAS